MHLFAKFKIMSYPEFQKMRLSLKSCYTLCLLVEEGKKKRSRNKKRNKKKEKNEFGPLLHCIIIRYTWPWMMEPSVPPSQQEPFWNLRVYACNLSGEINMWGICQILFSFYFNENNIFRWGDSFNYKTDSYNFTLIFFPSILQAWPSFAPHLWKKKQIYTLLCEINVFLYEIN